MSDTKTVPSYAAQLDALAAQLQTMLPADKLATFNADAQALAARFCSPLQRTRGDAAPPFSLPNAKGETVQSETLLKNGPLVLTFYRGVWCPYCNLQLKTYQQVLPDIKDAGAQLVAISPMTPDHSLNMVETNTLAFEVLSDVGNKVARQYSTVFKYADAPLQAMAELGYDFNAFYGDESGEVPVPATFVIDSHGTIVYAGSEGGDYRRRVEPQAILEALRAL